MKPLCSLCVILLLVGCSGKKQAERAFNAIDRIGGYSSRSDFEARVRDAEAALDEAKNDVGTKRYVALLTFESAAKHKYVSDQFSADLFERASRVSTPSQFGQMAASRSEEAKEDEDILAACRENAQVSVFGGDSKRKYQPVIVCAWMSNG
jgi:hypothetical protein